MTTETFVGVIAVVAQLSGVGAKVAELVAQIQEALDAVTVPIGVVCVSWIGLTVMVKSALGQADLGDLGDIKIPLIALIVLGTAHVLVDMAFGTGAGL